MYQKAGIYYQIISVESQGVYRCKEDVRYEGLLTALHRTSYLYESAKHHHWKPSTVSTINAPPSLGPSADISIFEPRRLTRSLARRCCGARSYDSMLVKMWGFRGGRKRSYLRVPTPPAAPVLVVCYG